MAEVILLEKLDRSIEKDIKNKVFIYPTDTIYSIGCNALRKDLVLKIREIRKEDNKPFSVIAPSKNWIYSNLIVNNKNYVKKMPGPYTFIFEIKKRCVVKEINNGMKTLSVRMPRHRFMKFISVPFVAASVNYFREVYVNDINKIPRGIKKEVDYIIDGGILYNKPSTIIDLTSSLPKIIRERK